MFSSLGIQAEDCRTYFRDHIASTLGFDLNFPPAESKSTGKRLARHGCQCRRPCILSSLPPASVVTGNDAVPVDMNALHQVCIAGSAAGSRHSGPASQLPCSWGHRLSAMETIGIVWCNGTLPRCFNGATAFRRWKRSENVRGNRQHPYFNGAVVELQEMTHRAKHIRKGLDLGDTRKYP